MTKTSRQRATTILDPLTKIRSEPLRAEARSAGTDPHIVLVELDLPCQQMGVERRGEGGALRLRFLGSAPPAGEADARVVEAARAMAGILGHDPGRFIAAAGAFVVEASGQQLCQIASLPLVGAIWPNDRVRPPVLP
jgi:hypothetical protein